LTILHDVNNTGPETLPVFIISHVRKHLKDVCLTFLIQFYMFCWLYFIPAFM